MLPDEKTSAPPATGPASRRRRAPRRFALAAAALVLASGLSACLSAPGSTDQVTKLATRTVDGWRYDYYRNTAYPCAISGYQTFAIGTKVGSSATAARPLWVKMHGGGAGWFSETGAPQPTAGQKTEESFDSLLKRDTPGLMADVKAAPEGFRVLIVSMCSHDVYGGTNTADPYNPNTTPDGKPRRTTGLIATKAAIQYAEAGYPTTDFFLHGTSAGSAGSFNVAWGLQQQGIAPTGIIADSGVINQEWERYVAENGVSGSTGCEKATVERGDGVLGRIDADLADPANQPDLLVSRGALTVPVLHVWNHADQNSCGDAPMPCPLRDGSTPTLNAADCRHEPLTLAIEAQGAGSRSKNLGLCVEGKDTTVPCDRHVLTNGRFANTDLAAAPADYTATILTWVRQRLADD